MSHLFLLNEQSRGAEIARWLGTSIFGAFVTTLLLLGMDRLIFSERVLDEPSVTYKVPNPIYVPVEIETIKELPPKKIEEPVEEPIIELQLPEVEFESTQYASLKNVSFKPPVDKTIHFNASEPIPNVLVQPEYPSIAARKGIEGYVDLQFDVSEIGATENIQVLKAEPERVFNRAAVNAVKRWKFTPIRKDGKPAKYQGMTHRITFQMES